MAQETTAQNDLLAGINEENAAFGNGGSRTPRVYFCKGKIELGLKVYPPSGSGLAQTASWFPYDPKNKASKEKAMAGAQALIAEHKLTDKRAGHEGEPASPTLAIQLTIFKDTVQNGAADTWQGHQYKLVPTWQAAFKENWTKAIQRCNITQYGEFWMKVILEDDPQRKEPWTHKVTDPATGQEVEKTDQVAVKVWVPECLYPTETAMITAAKEYAAANANGNGAAAPSGPSGAAGLANPPEYPAGLWATFLPKVLADLKNGMSAADVANNYALQLPYVMQIAQAEGL